MDRSSFSLSLCVAVRGSDLSGSWIGVDRRYEMWIGELVVLLCVRLFCVSPLFRSVLLCVESDPEMN